VCFSKTDTTEKNDIAFILDKFETEEILYLLLVDFMRPAPLELLQCFDLGETGKRNPTLGGAILALKRLSANELGEEIEIRPLFLSCQFGERIVMIEDIIEFEIAKLLVELSNR